MHRDEVAQRKLAVMHAAAARWDAKAPDLAEAARRLARGGSEAATSKKRRDQFVAREALKRELNTYRIGVERTIGPTFDLDDIPPTDRARTAGRPVARIVELIDGRNIGEGFATGFVVTPGVLVTNWHVFPEARDARGCGAHFGFERAEGGLLEPGVVFEIDPARFFVSNEALDIAIVGLAPTPVVGHGTLTVFGSTRLIPAQGKILVGHPISIIQHPDGRHKHWGVRENKLVVEPKDDDIFISYTTDTLGGSSGSPAFNHDWELVAVHHSGVPRRERGVIMTKRNEEWRPGMPDADIDWVANEGARVSKICEHLQTVQLQEAGAQKVLTAVVAAATDPVSDESLAAQKGAPMTDRDGSANIMNVVVHGTANFYFGSDARPAGIVEPAPPGDRSPRVGVEKKLRFDPDYPHRPGYNSRFLTGFDVPRPKAPLDEALLGRNDDEWVLKYHHYSLVMHRERRLAMWTAANIDYDEAKRTKDRKEFGSDTWKPDPRIPIEAQIEDVEFYAPAAKFDRGHLVRRDDVAWGAKEEEEEYGNSDSFHWTNCTPQHEHFNRDLGAYKGLWGSLENHIAKQAGYVDNLVILFSGPVLDPGDEARDFGSGIEVQVPIVFWKVVIAVDTTANPPQLRAYGFLLDQTEAIRKYGWEGRYSVGKFKEQQVSLRDITDRTRVEFHQSLHAVDPLANVAAEARMHSLRSLDDLVLR